LRAWRDISWIANLELREEYTFESSCHLGPDHPDIEIYLSSKHGQIFNTRGEDWNWDAAPDTWEPGDYRAPTCAPCHMGGTEKLSTTHNINERLKWALMHKRSVIRSGERGDGVKGRPLMIEVCSACHSSTHTKAIMTSLDHAVQLYNLYYDKATAMLDELKAKKLLKDDSWKGPFQELHYYLWHHTDRRARQGAAMNGPDYAHWHGFFQIFQVYKDMEDIYTYRIEHNKIEYLSTVMSSGPRSQQSRQIDVLGSMRSIYSRQRAASRWTTRSIRSLLPIKLVDARTGTQPASRRESQSNRISSVPGSCSLARSRSNTFIFDIPGSLKCTLCAPVSRILGWNWLPFTRKV